MRESRVNEYLGKRGNGFWVKVLVGVVTVLTIGLFSAIATEWNSFAKASDLEAVRVEVKNENEKQEKAIEKVDQKVTSMDKKLGQINTALKILVEGYEGD